jgi:hypothetical protein
VELGENIPMLIRYKKCTKNLFGKHEGRYNYEDLRADEYLILKWTLKKLGVTK